MVNKCTNFDKIKVFITVILPIGVRGLNFQDCKSFFGFSKARE